MHGLDLPFQDLRRDLRHLERAVRENRSKGWKAQPNYQFQVLHSLFFRNKAAYIVGRLINGADRQPFVIPLLRNPDGTMTVDALLMRQKDVAVLFSFSRAYFLVDMEVPSAYVRFLLSIMPRKSPVDLYAMLGLQKQDDQGPLRPTQDLDRERSQGKIPAGEEPRPCWRAGRYAGVFQRGHTA